MSDLRALLAAATPRPWTFQAADEPGTYLADVTATWQKLVDADDADDPGLDLIPAFIEPPRMIDLEDDGGYMTKADAALGCAAVNELPALLDRLDALERVAKAARAIADRHDRSSTCALCDAIARLDEP